MYIAIDIDIDYLSFSQLLNYARIDLTRQPAYEVKLEKGGLAQ